MSETSILMKIKEGDEAAFPMLYDHYWLKIYNFAELYIATPYEISEVVLDVLRK